MKNVITLALGLGMLTASTGCCLHNPYPPACGPGGCYYSPGANLGGATTFPQGAFYSSPATTIGATDPTPYYENAAYQQPATYAPTAYAPAGYSQTAMAPPMQALPTY